MKLWLSRYIMIGMTMNKKLTSILMIFLIIMMPMGVAPGHHPGSGDEDDTSEENTPSGEGSEDEDEPSEEEKAREEARANIQATIDKAVVRAQDISADIERLGLKNDVNVKEALKIAADDIGTMNQMNKAMTDMNIDPVAAVEMVGKVAESFDGLLDEVENRVANYDKAKNGEGGMGDKTKGIVDSVTSGYGVLGYDDNTHARTMEAYNGNKDHYPDPILLDEAGKPKLDWDGRPMPDPRASEFAEDMLVHGGLENAERVNNMLDTLKDEYRTDKDYRTGNVVKDLVKSLETVKDWDGFFGEGGTLNAFEERIDDVVSVNNGLGVAVNILSLVPFVGTAITGIKIIDAYKKTGTLVGVIEGVVPEVVKDVFENYIEFTLQESEP